MQNVINIVLLKICNCVHPNTTGPQELYTGYEIIEKIIFIALSKNYLIREYRWAQKVWFKNDEITSKCCEDWLKRQLSFQVAPLKEGKSETRQERSLESWKRRTGILKALQAEKLV